MTSQILRAPSSPLSRQIKISTATFLAAAAMFASASSASAGTAEVNALQLKLGKPLYLATSAELLAAYDAVIADTTKYNTPTKRAVVAGEALKGAGPSATDAGAVFGAALTDGAGSNDVAEPDRITFVGITAKTAGAGKGLNVTQIPDLSAALINGSTDSIANNNARAAAALAGSNVAKGAVLGGRASELADDAAKTAFAVAALGDSKLKAAVQDISRFIAVEVTDASAANFAVALATSSPTSTLKIAPGVAAGKPTLAGAITSALLSNATVGATARAGAATLVKSVAAVADIEEIAKIAAAVSAQIGANVATKPIKLSQAQSITTTLAKAILAKPSSAVGANRIANKQDELGELAAYMIGGLASNTDAKKKASTTATTIVNIIKAAASAGLIKDKINPATGVAFSAAELAQIQFNASRDIVASAALTIQNATWGLDTAAAADIKTAIFDLLLKKDAKGVYTTIASIAGIGKANATDNNGVALGGDPLAVQNVKDAILGINTGRFENGLLGNVSDPETDTRPL